VVARAAKSRVGSTASVSAGAGDLAVLCSRARRYSVSRASSRIGGGAPCLLNILYCSTSWLRGDDDIPNCQMLVCVRLVLPVGVVSQF
jgi:hypothetical protein